MRLGRQHHSPSRPSPLPMWFHHAASLLPGRTGHSPNGPFTKDGSADLTMPIDSLRDFDGCTIDPTLNKSSHPEYSTVIVKAPLKSARPMASTFPTRPSCKHG